MKAGYDSSSLDQHGLSSLYCHSEQREESLTLSGTKTPENNQRSFALLRMTGGGEDGLIPKRP
jgi:hypothetical protein